LIYLIHFKKQFSKLKPESNKSIEHKPSNNEIKYKYKQLLEMPNIKRVKLLIMHMGKQMLPYRTIKLKYTI